MFQLLTMVNLKFLIILVFKFNLIFCGLVQYPKDIGRIVGGENSTIEEIPWQIKIHYFSKLQCGGAIINENTILTAAHCFETYFKDPNVFKVSVGSNQRESDSNELFFNVSEILIHPEFVPDTFENDVAIVKLNKSLTFTKKVQAIEIVKNNTSLAVGEYGLASGWGSLNVNGEYPQTLQKVELKILPQNVCIEKYKSKTTIKENMFCAGGDGIKDACNGDSGGPFVVNKTLTGIISYGIKCALPEYPGVFTRISVLRDWIDQNI